MKVLLIKPLYRFASNHPVQFSGSEKALPLSLAYLAAALEKEGHVIRVLDYQIETPPLRDVLSEFQPGLVGVTSYSKEFDHAKEIMREIKVFRPHLPVVVGGPHINAYRENIFSQSADIDYAIVNEGEETFLELLKRLDGGQDVAGVRGLIYRDGSGQIHFNGPRPFIKDIDTIPFMALHHFQVKKYYPTAGTFRRLPSVTMLTSRGCPYRCVFCNTDLFGKNVRLRSAENVLAEIESLVKKYGAREINFCDETITINRARMIKICEGLIKRNLRIGWKCSTRVDLVDTELLKLMKRSGCFYIGFGAESGVQATLDRLKKGITLDQTRQAFAECKKIGIDTMAYFMMNVPGETIEDIETSIRFSREIKPTFLNFELIKPYCGTELRQMIEGNPDLTINHALWEKWESYSAGNHLFYVQKNVPESYLLDAYKRAVKDFYLRPGFILRALFKIRSLRQLVSYLQSFLNMLKVRLVR
ncbi:MAG: radical SAM protein [Candidatus Omnitrophota bacterium]